MRRGPDSGVFPNSPRVLPHAFRCRGPIDNHCGRSQNLLALRVPVRGPRSTGDDRAMTTANSSDPSRREILTGAAGLAGAAALGATTAVALRSAAAQGGSLVRRDAA